MKTKSISVVIGVRNMQDTIGKTIQSVLDSNYKNKEILIVNDGSTDKTKEVVETFSKKYKNVRLISSNPIGISSARNIGFKNSKGELVAYTDADCTVDKNWLSNLSRNFNDEKVALVGGRTIFETGKDIFSLCRAVEFEQRYSKVPENTLSAMGPNCIFRKSVLEEVNGFNPKWFHGEDAEISYMIKKKGYAVKFDSSAVVNHAPEEGFRRYFKKRMRDASAFMRVAKKYPSYSIKDRFIPFDLISQPLIFLLCFVSMPFLYPFAVMNSVGLFSNVPISLKVYKKTGKVPDFFKSLGVFYLRGYALALSMIKGLFFVFNS